MTSTDRRSAASRKKSPSLTRYSCSLTRKRASLPVSTRCSPPLSNHLRLTGENQGGRLVVRLSEGAAVTGRLRASAAGERPQRPEIVRSRATAVRSGARRRAGDAVALAWFSEFALPLMARSQRRECAPRFKAGREQRQRHEAEDVIDPAHLKLRQTALGASESAAAYGPRVDASQRRVPAPKARCLRSRSRLRNGGVLLPR